MAYFSASSMKGKQTVLEMNSNLMLGKGYATELSRRAIRFGFDEIGLDEVAWGVREDHVTSRKDWNNQDYNFKKGERL